MKWLLIGSVFVFAVVRISQAGGIKWRDDLRCGTKYPLADGSPAQCDPDAIYPCCSPYNWCGNTNNHCTCSDCIDYRRDITWRDDLRCGPNYPLADGSPAQCDPDAIYPCCSPYDWCGKTENHCTCSRCIDYRQYDSSKRWRADLRCGPNYPLADGSPAQCDPDAIFPCCSPYDWCGNTANHCTCSDCIDYRQYDSSKRWRDDLRCGPNYPLADGSPAQCDPDAIFPCCSPYDWCGNTANHCTCSDCIDYRQNEISNRWRDDLRCGPNYPLADGSLAQCDPDGIYPCCSPYNWCGNTANHCTCSGCIDYRGLSETKTEAPPPPPPPPPPAKTEAPEVQTTMIPTLPPCEFPANLHNVAQGKAANQSSDRVRTDSEAANAVDGNYNSDANTGSCSWTSREYEPWWKLDLLDTFNIYEVVITNRADCCPFRIKNAEIRVGDSANFAENPVCGMMILGRMSREQPIHIRCGCETPMRGRYVSVQLIDKDQMLTMCEVEVMVA